MNILLIFFALPIATIIISIALQKILKCPPLVASIIFAIFLIVTFSINNLTFLIATIVYTIISFITAVIVCIICKILERNRRNLTSCFGCNCGRSNCKNNDNGELLTISSCDWNGISNDLLTISSNNLNENNNCNNSNNCVNNSNNTNGVMARINVIPTSNNNVERSCNCRCCRR